MKKIKIKFKQNVNPLFADEVMVGIGVKATKRNERIEKEGYVRLGFIDMAKKEVFAEVILSRITAKALVEILKKNLEKLEKELKSEKVPKIETKESEFNYIG